MKGAKITLIAILGGVVLGLCVFLGLSLNGNFSWSVRPDERPAFGSARLMMEKEIAADKIKSIVVDYGRQSNDVFLYPAEGDNIIVREYATYELSENEKTTVQEENGKLTVKGRKRNKVISFEIGKRWIYTEIYLPESYLKELDIRTVSGDIAAEMDLAAEKTLKASSTSGDITLLSISAKEINISTTSGEITVSDSSAEKVNISTTSGDIRLEKATAEKLDLGSTSGEITASNVSAEETKISTTSGDIRSDNIESKKTKVSTTSGDVRLGTVKGDLTCSAISGDIGISEGTGARDMESTSGCIRMTMTEVSEDISIDTVSGDVTLELPETVSLSFTANTTSGGINTFFDNALNFSKRGDHAAGEVGDGEKTVLKINTTSGNIRVVK